MSERASYRDLNRSAYIDRVIGLLTQLQEENPDGKYPPVIHDRGWCEECDAIRMLETLEDS